MLGLALNEMLIRNGFEVVKQYDLDGNDFIAYQSLHILTVARKKRGYLLVIQ